MPIQWYLAPAFRKDGSLLHGICFEKLPSGHICQ
jgi:hypothetical protein